MEHNDEFVVQAIDFARNYARYNNDNSYLRAATLVEEKLMGHVVEEGAVFPDDLSVAAGVLVKQG